jgi:hypothetical protein
LRNVLTAEQKSGVYGLVSDSMPLMLTGFLALLAGVAAVLMSWANSRARWLLLASLVLLVGGNVIIPMLVPHIRVSDSGGTGALLRALLHLLVVVLAALGARAR